MLRIVEDILYAPSEEEGERILGQAMAELEARGADAPSSAMGPDAAEQGAEPSGAEAAPTLLGPGQELGCAA